MKKFVKQGEKELGVVVSVDSDEAVVGMYNVTNGASYFIDGEEINGIKVGAYAILKQGRNRIVVTVFHTKMLIQSVKRLLLCCFQKCFMKIRKMIRIVLPFI